MRVGIIGLGSIGSRRARLLASFPQVDEMVVYDSDGGRVADFVLNLNAPITNAEGTQAIVPADDLDELLSLKPDAVFICTPAETHIDVAFRCLHEDVAGTFIEKPLSTNMDSVDALRRWARESVVTVACNMRWAYNLSGPYAQFCARDARPLSSWRSGSEVYRQNGIVMESAIHMMDLAYSVNGRIANMDGCVTEDYAHIEMLHENGCESVVIADWSELHEKETPLRYAGTQVTSSSVCRRQVPDTSDEMYRKEMAHFLDCVKGYNAPCNTPDDAAHVLSWALRAKELAA